MHAKKIFSCVIHICMRKYLPWFVAIYENLVCKKVVHRFQWNFCLSQKCQKRKSTDIYFHIRRAITVKEKQVPEKKYFFLWFRFLIRNKSFTWRTTFFFNFTSFLPSNRSSKEKLKPSDHLKRLKQNAFQSLIRLFFDINKVLSSLLFFWTSDRSERKHGSGQWYGDSVRRSGERIRRE